MQWTFGAMREREPVLKSWMRNKSRVCASWLEIATELLLAKWSARGFVAVKNRLVAAHTWTIRAEQRESSSSTRYRFLQRRRRRRADSLFQLSRSSQRLHFSSSQKSFSLSLAGALKQRCIFKVAPI